jgi:predicted GNAT family acetyltransferase
MSITVHYKLKDYKETFAFEREHPKPLRWDDRYKMYMLTENSNVQGIWLKEKGLLIGEIIMTWQSKNVVHVESLTVSLTHRGKGYGYDLVKSAIEWATNSDYEFMVGEARKGHSWKIFENFGAVPVLLYKDWNGTKEDYMSFKLDL